MLFTCSDNQKKAIDFRKLECLRLFCRQILLDQVASLNYFAYEYGFTHVRGGTHVSVSSSATCALSLVATGSWKADGAQTKALLHDLLSRRNSAGLADNNPFTIAWILEAATELEACSDPLDPGDAARVGEMEGVLQKEVKEGGGGVRIKDYPHQPI